jgi:tetratricopeptide (TPR) repeat protein
MDGDERSKAGAAQIKPAPRWLVGWLLLLAPLVIVTQAAETNAVPEGGLRPTNAITAVEMEQLRTEQLRAYLRLQEQLHSTLMALEQGRQQSSLEARTNAETLAARLELLEQSLARQRDQQWEALQNSNRTMLMFAAGAIGLGLMALAFTAIFQSRGMNRLAEIAGGLGQERAFLPGPNALPAALGSGEPLLLSAGAQNPGRNLLATVERLQQRIQELERTAHPELPFADLPPAARNGSAEELPAVDHLAALVGKAQVLLGLGQTEEALACYEQALREAPAQAELHLRRGQALEKLKRFDEALAGYDRALQLNRHLTQAYLSKGSVFNQLERYSEALACYEQALHAESKS